MHKNLPMQIVAWIGLIFLGSPTLGETYNYHPSSSLYLGSNFDPKDIAESYPECLSHEGERPVDGQGAVRTVFTNSLIKSRRDLFEQVHFSARMSARGAFWGARGTYSSFSQHRFHTDSISWIVKAETDYGRFKLKNPTLKPHVQRLIDRGRLTQAKLHCGTEFIDQVRKAVMVAAVFSVHNVSEEEKRKVEASFKGGMSYGSFDASARASYKNFYAEATRVSQIHVTIYAIGGKGITELSSLAVNGDKLEEVRKVLKNYIDQMTVTYSVPVEYTSGSLSRFGFRNETSSDFTRRDRTLSNLYFDYQKAVETRRRLDNILDHSDSYEFGGVPEHEFERYQKQFDEYSIYITQILEKADACRLDQTNCTLVTRRPSRVRWPISLVGQCEKQRLNAYELGLISGDQLTEFRELEMAPVIVLQQIKAWQPCQN